MTTKSALLRVAAELLVVAEPDLFLLDGSGWKSEADWRADVEKWQTAYQKHTTKPGAES